MAILLSVEKKVRSYLEDSLDPSLVAQLDQLDPVYFALGALAMEAGIPKLNDFKAVIRDELKKTQSPDSPVETLIPGLSLPINTATPSVTNIPRPVVR